jgi:hypothetical protein
MWRDVPVLTLVDDVGALANSIVAGVNIPRREDDADADEVRVHALWFMTIIALRATRAAVGVISLGYEDQAIGYTRLVDELHGRAQKLCEDASGDLARQWLSGRWNPKGAKLAGQDFWEMLSGPVHANVRAVLDWIAISEDNGSANVVVGPERRPEIANGTLVYLSGELRDLAAMLANAARISIDFSEIDGAIKEAQDLHIPDAIDEPGK